MRHYCKRDGCPNSSEHGWPSGYCGEMCERVDLLDGRCVEATKSYLYWQHHAASACAWARRWKVLARLKRVELDDERQDHRETSREAEAQIVLNERLREQVERLRTGLWMEGDLVTGPGSEEDRLRAEVTRLRDGLTAYRRLANVTGRSVLWGDEESLRAVVAWERESAERALD